MEVYMKRILCAVLLTLIVAAGSYARTFTMRGGVLAAAEFSYDPQYIDIQERFMNGTALMPGLWGEMIFGNLGFGYTGLVSFQNTDTGNAANPYNWSMDFIGSLEMRYHFFGGRSFLDPFVEVGAGSAGHIDLYSEPPSNWTLSSDGTCYEYTGSTDEWWSETQYLKSISLFAQAGLGLSLRFSGLVITARMDYRFDNSPIPVTQFPLYPLNPFEFSLMAGFSM
jgi:hypothetical protein